MVNTEFGKIGILMGGPSTEREISLKSGHAVYNALKLGGLEAEEIDITTDDLDFTADAIRKSNIDVAFIALHGRFGEDGTIQSILEKLDIPYTGSAVEASRLAMDKVASREIFQERGLKVPRYQVLCGKRYNLDSRICFPVVVKPVSHGSSIGLSIVKDRAHLARAVDAAFALDKRVIIEEYIRGREFTAGILSEKALPIIEIKPKNLFFDYEAKYQPGMTEYVVPAAIDENLARNLQEAGLLAHRSLNCFGCSRVDMILGDDNNIYVLEVNTIPGLTQTSLLPKAAVAAGIGFLELCKELIRLAYEKQKDKAVY